MNAPRRTLADSVDNSNDGVASVSQHDFVQCPDCSQTRFFKGQRGLKIHQSKCHKIIPPSTCSIIDLPLTQDTGPFWKSLAYCKFKKPTIKRIPRGARQCVATTLSQALKAAVAQNSQQAWEHLLSFPYTVLHINSEPTNKKSLTVRIKENCVKYSVPDFKDSFCTNFSNYQQNFSHSVKPCLDSSLYKNVESKISDGDIRGAARILFSNDTIATPNPETLSILKDKHPSPAINSVLPDPPESHDILEATTVDVSVSIMSFQSGSASGLDGLTPQHLKDLIGGGNGEAGEGLLRDLTGLVNLMLSGKVLKEVTPVLYGANLCALMKKDGGIRPIAVGMTYRRLAAKICCKKIAPTLKSFFQPIQLGFGTQGGCEAIVHAVRSYISHNNNLLLKVDVKNAFNSVDRGALLTQIKNKIPNVYNFLWQCYSEPSKLTYMGNEISSSVGCQQGDPLGPAVFSLAIHPIIQRLESKLNAWYLDDGTLGADADTLYNDLLFLISEFQSIGLDLNFSKCELYIPSCFPDKNQVIKKFNSVAPNIKIIDNSSLRLLGSPVLDESFPLFISEKIQNFQQCSDRLFKLNAHMAFTIIRFCLFVPKFMYVLRCSHLWKFDCFLQNLDTIIQTTLANLLNINLLDREWQQASLPVRMGGLGIRSISGVALPAFLASVHSNQDLIAKILSATTSVAHIVHMNEARDAWTAKSHSSEFPKCLSSQKQWDRPFCEQARYELLNTCSSSTERARLLAVGEWESGLWLQALPSSKIGTLLDNESFRVITSLRLGASCCAPHHCQCGANVDQLGHHGLSCQKSTGRIPRHASLNDIIRRALTTADCAAILEPNGLIRSDGKRPDGMTLIPWKMGRPLVWDATCVDTLAPSHLSHSERAAGTVAEAAETLKRHKYSNLDSAYIFVPFGVETLGPWGPGAKILYREISKRLVDATRDQYAGLYFAQRVSLAIQRGNAASILGTLPTGSGLLD